MGPEKTILMVIRMGECCAGADPKSGLTGLQLTRITAGVQSAPGQIEGAQKLAGQSQRNHLRVGCRIIGAQHLKFWITQLPKTVIRSYCMDYRF